MTVARHVSQRLRHLPPADVLGPEAHIPVVPVLEQPRVGLPPQVVRTEAKEVVPAPEFPLNHPLLWIPGRVEVDY